MSRTGRPPKPTVLKVLAGNPGKRPLPENEPQPPRGLPPAPDFLDDIAMAKWTELAPRLEAMGLLTLVDGDTLAAYCVAWSELAHATQTLTDEGREIPTEGGGYKAHPAVAAQRSALMALAKLGGLFGLNPADRARVKAGKPEGDELDDFMKGAQ